MMSRGKTVTGKEDSNPAQAGPTAWAAPVMTNTAPAATRARNASAAQPRRVRRSMAASGMRWKSRWHTSTSPADSTMAASGEIQGVEEESGCEEGQCGTQGRQDERCLGPAGRSQPVDSQEAQHGGHAGDVVQGALSGKYRAQFQGNEGEGDGRACGEA